MPTDATVSAAINPVQLRAIRTDLGRSQADFAAMLRKAGVALGEPNGATKRLVQKWEAGEHRMVRPNYQRALELATGLPFATFCDVRPVAYATFPSRLDRIIRELTALRADLVLPTGEHYPGQP